MFFVEKKPNFNKTQIIRQVKRENPLKKKHKTLCKRVERSLQVNKIQMNNQTNLSRTIKKKKKPSCRYASRPNLNVLNELFRD